jgi:hypothetical protein
VVCAGLVAATAGYGASRLTQSGSNVAGYSHGLPEGATVTPTSPGALAVGPGGQLYVVDDGANEVLEYSHGHFRIVAGHDRAGYSGDGGPALKATLDRPTGIAASSSGALYIADAGNNRVREILPDGVIRTVIGTGRQPRSSWIADGTPPLSADIYPTSVAIGPDGRLAVSLDGPSEVIELVGGSLRDAAGTRVGYGCGYNGPAATDLGVDDPNSVAFDTAGNLYLDCSGPFDVLEVPATGRAIERGTMRSHGWLAALAAAPNGKVYGLWQSTVVEFTASAELTVKSFTRLEAGFAFWPTGIAVASDGSLYLDQSAGGGVGPPALIHLGISGGVHLLWDAPPTHN